MIRLLTDDDDGETEVEGPALGGVILGVALSLVLWFLLLLLLAYLALP